ncbi:MAG TPA: xanthine dehydrogenase family protein molybdopterin-binding subunit [Xanthobacteraceae bacterium]|nr:xanthine dehydrogenase family protein molybdopterin-binding subunit [Xanthobacteraceae bacterium]
MHELAESQRPNTYVGAPVERVEDLRFLRGRGCYLDDLSRSGQWHAAFVRSPFAHGTIRRIDTRAARAKRGVRAVITGGDIGPAIPTIPFRRPNPTIAPYGQPVIATEVVRYVGEPVAMVLADAPELAEDASLAVELDIAPLAVVIDRRAAVAGDTLLFPATTSNCATTFTAAIGDVEVAFRDAPYTRRDSLRVQRQTAFPMETRGLLAEWDGRRLTVSGAAKLPFFNRRALAAMMGLPDTAVDYIEYDVGGGFGARGEFYPEDFLCAFAARRYGHPIKWVEDRREHFMTIAHAREAEGDIEIALERDGTIRGIRGEIFVDIGAYVRPNGTTPVRNVAQFLAGPYRVPHLRLQAHAMVSNKTPTGTFRGPGRFEGAFFCERLLDLAAGDLGLDRLDIRRRNLLTATEMPYRLAPIVPDDGLGKTQCDSGDYTRTFDLCIAEFGWAEKVRLNGRLIEGRYHGVGVACFIEGGGSGPREHARMEVEPDGTVAVYVGSSAVGQGVETIMGQIAADALHVPMSRVRVLHASTTYLRDGVGSFGSRATVMGGSAIVDAANNLLDALRAAAATQLDVPPQELRLGDGIVQTGDGRGVTWAELAHAHLCVEGVFQSSRPTYSYGTAAVHVAVDPRTGHVEILDYLVVDDVGRIVNPLTLHGQVIGAAVQGCGTVFGERLAYDADGQLLVASLADYLVPLAADYPNLRAVSLEEYPSPNNPLGVKGSGEGGIIPVGGAVANAVAAALSAFGVEPRELPLSPPAVWQLIEQARA